MNVTNSKEEIATAFNRVITQLATIAVQLNKNNDDIYRMSERIKLAISYVPIQIIELVGPEIYEYRKEISTGNLDHFLNIDFEAKYSDEIDMIKKEGIDFDVSKLIKIFKNNWTTLKPKEREIITDKTQILLSEYCKYMLKGYGNLLT